MNQETLNPLFGGFQPQVIEGNALPVEPAAPPAGKKTRKSKKKKAVAAAIPSEAAPLPAAPAKPSRKPRTPKAVAKRAPKFDLQTILAATAGLKETDMAGFEKGLNVLMDANAAGRARLLAAWAKVFA